MNPALIAEKALDIGCHRLEGEDQKPTKGTIVMNTSTDRRTVAEELECAAHTLGVRPSAVAPDPWTSETIIDSAEADPTITHNHEYSLGPFTVVLSHMISDVDHGTDVIVKWDARGTGSSSPEAFSVATELVPALIGVLFSAHSMHTNARLNAPEARP